MLRKVIIALMGASMLFAGCTSNEVPETSMPEVEHQTYIMAGRYYHTSGELFTEDGNSWGFTQDIISEKPSYDNQPVFALFDDMGTANKFDDEVLGLVWDVETAIYDELEVVLSEDFNIERNGNNIHISMDPEQ